MDGGSPFWRFSLRLYGRPGVGAACVALQDAHDLDVNLLLFALWLASEGRAVSADDLRAAEAATRAWRLQAVVPLRAVRRFIKEPPPALDAAGVAALRERVKAAELESERLQQEALFALRPLDGWGAAAAPADAAAANMDACAATFGAAFAAGPRSVILDAFAGLRASAT
jgi:uncharacterized protein (TIGR02444 family)